MTVIDNTVVITGVSGRYSEADSIQEFWEKLLGSVPMYSSDARRWPQGEFCFYLSLLVCSQYNIGSIIELIVV